MEPRISKILSLTFCGIIFSFLALGPAVVNGFDGIETDVLGVAIQGYDPVAYFTEGRPVMGNSDFSYIWNEAEWHFASAENRDLFASNPKKYSPNHSGFCAVSMPASKFAGENPEQFKIVNGKLYLGWNPNESN
jgi:YHS domain-containing protein